jgi:flagellar hook-length control protein FliK
MAEHVEITLTSTPNQHKLHIETRSGEIRREVEDENARLREENDSLKLQVAQLTVSNERSGICRVCYNQLSNSPRSVGAAVQPLPQL